MSPARRHHTVPRFYLNGFALDGKIGTVELPGRKRFPLSVTNASVHTDFYNLPDLGEEEDLIERALSELETAASGVFAEITKGTWPLSLSSRHHLAEFVAVQSARVPSIRAAHDELFRQLTRAEIGFAGKERVRSQLEAAGPVSDEQFSAYWSACTRVEGPPVSLSTQFQIQLMLDVIPELIPRILARQWALVIFQRLSLFTSDTPVCLMPEDDHPQERGVGFENAGAILMPLSRKVGLCMLSPGPLLAEGVSLEDIMAGRLDRRTRGTRHYERLFNGCAISHAERWIFHHPGDAGLIPDDLPEPRKHHYEGLPFDFD